MKPVVVLTAKYPAIAREILSGLCEFIEHPAEQRSEEEMITILSEADAAITLPGDPLTRKVLAANPGLRMIASYAAGYDNIDIDAARELGIIVTNTPGALTDSTADLTMGLEERRSAMARSAATDVALFLRGQRPLHPVV